MIKENFKVVGSLKIELFDEHGNLKDVREIENLIVNSGIAFIAQRLISTPTAMSHMAIGTGTTAASAAQTALVAEVGRVALTSSTNITTTVTNDTVQYVASFPAGTGTGAITEAGIFNAASAGTMLNRTVFSVVNKGAGDAMSITWNVKAA